MDGLALLGEAKLWADRAEENYAKVDLYKDRRCRLTMLALAEQAEKLAERAAALALKVAALTGDEGMQSQAGLHPYRAALFFLLREYHQGNRHSRQAKAALMAGNVEAIRQWQVVRCIAHSFGKTNTDVASDLVETFNALEHGSAAP